MFRYLREKNIKFRPLPQTEDQTALISESNSSVEALDSLSRTKPSRLPITLLFTLSLPIAAILGAWIGSQWFSDANSFCINRVSQSCKPQDRELITELLIHCSAPVVKDLDITYEIVAFNGSLLKENIFRQDASPEVDAAWKSLGVDCE